MKPTLLNRIRPFLTALSFSVWWGGLTFYALVVVPVATETFGSTEQGFVTQRVTNWLNILAAVWLAFSLSPSMRNRLPIFLWVVQVVSLLFLVVLHWRLDAMLDSVQLNITGDNFYNVHRIYLWATALHWATGAALFWSIMEPARRAP